LIRGRGKGYALLPFLPGMYENVLMEGDDTPWHREFARIANRLYETGYIRKYLEHPTRIARSIQIGVSLDATSNAVDHDSVEKMIRAHDMLAVLNNCQCRHARFLEGHECRRADRLDGCLAFGDFARLYIERGGARQVSRDTMRSIVDDRREKKLLFLAGNVMPESTNHICTCCDCCCHMLGQIVSFDPGLLITPPKYLVAVDDARCTNCGKCLAACNLMAHTMKGKRHEFDQKRCIGCGLCVGVCKSAAIELLENNNYKKPAKSFKHLAVRLAPSKMMAVIKTKLKRKERL
jgi:ferredoxin